MKTILTLLLTFTLGWPSSAVTNEHEFHLSRVRVEYSDKQQEWEISLHIFIDDLELAIEERGAPNLRLGTGSELPEADDYIKKYLKQFLAFEAEELPLEWEWLGKETSEDLSAFHIYLYLPQANPRQALTIKNRLLLGLYDDQQNMLQFIGPDKQPKQLLFHRDFWQAELNK